MLIKGNSSKDSFNLGWFRRQTRKVLGFDSGRTNTVSFVELYYHHKYISEVKIVKWVYLVRSVISKEGILSEYCTKNPFSSTEESTWHFNFRYIWPSKGDKTGTCKKAKQLVI